MNISQGEQEVRIYHTGDCEVEVIPTFLKQKLFQLAKDKQYGQKTKDDIEAKLKRAEEKRQGRFAVRGQKEQQVREVQERKASAECVRVQMAAEKLERREKLQLSTIAQQRLEKARIHAEKVKAAQARKAIIREEGQRQARKAFEYADRIYQEKVELKGFKTNRERAEACRKRNEVILLKASKTLLHAKSVKQTAKLSIVEKQAKAEARRLAIQNERIQKAKDAQTKHFHVVEKTAEEQKANFNPSFEESKTQEVAEVNPMKVSRHFMGESIYMKDAGEKCDQIKEKLDKIVEAK